jgi:hypothetical protein
MTPIVAETTMRRKPSARPHTSSSFAMGIYTAAVMESVTIPITARSECDWKSLVTYGVRAARMEERRPFAR